MKYAIILLLLLLNIGISAFADESMSNCVLAVKQKLDSIDKIVTQYFDGAEAPTNNLPSSRILARQISTEELKKKSNKLNYPFSMLLEKDEKKIGQQEVQLITDALTKDDTKALTEISLSVLEERMKSSLNKGTELIIKKARGEAKSYDNAQLQKAITQYQTSKVQLRKLKRTRALDHTEKAGKLSN
jgi:hypothetical protein